MPSDVLERGKRHLTLALLALGLTACGGAEDSNSGAGGSSNSETTMRADPDIGDDERAAAMQALRDKFALADDEIERLIELATTAAAEAYDYQRFTGQLNRAFDAARKLRVIELMWQVAYADGHLHAHEAHVMRKVADLLYIPHADYITAKLAARDGVGAH